jgi:sugar lactone lactonase YvrE
MKKLETIVEVVLPHACQLGEGPLWDATRKRILWVDILNGEIHQFYPDKSEHKITVVHSLVGCIALRSSGEVIAALKPGFHTIDLETGAASFIAAPENHLPGIRFNDGKCDPAGRFWAGTMSVMGTRGAAALYTLNTDHTISCKVEKVTCSNGLAWSPDHTTLYYIDTPTGVVMAYDYDLLSGNIANGRQVIQIPPMEGSPDGMTIDTEGMLWIAMWNGWQITRWDPATGELLQRIPLPVANVTSCTFGGEYLRDLYITTALEGLSAEEQKAQPLAGYLFVIENCGYEGLPPFEFAG